VSFTQRILIIILPIHMFRVLLYLILFSYFCSYFARLDLIPVSAKVLSLSVLKENNYKGSPFSRDNYISVLALKNFLCLVITCVDPMYDTNKRLTADFPAEPRVVYRMQNKISVSTVILTFWYSGLQCRGK